jgi:predicted ferric reductase
MSTVGKVIGASESAGAPGKVLSSLPVGSILKIHLDKPHPSFLSAEILSASPGVPLPPGLNIGSNGWVSKSSIVIATSLTASFAYEATGPDEASFNENDQVYGFKEMDGWWDGYSTTPGMFPANYVTVDSPQPTFIAAPAAPTPAPPPPPPSSAPAAAAPPSYENPSKSLLAPQQQRDAKMISAAPPAAAAPEGKFKGKKPQQYAIWARNLGVGAGFITFWCGLFTALWAHGKGYVCKVEGHWIHHSYIYNSSHHDGCEDGSANKYHCCDAGVCCLPNRFRDVDINGSVSVGVFGCLISLVIFYLEEENIGWGLYQPTDSFFYAKKVSPHAIFYFLISLPMFTAYPSAYSSVCLLLAAAIHQVSYRREEAGDGGREQKAAAKQRKAEQAAKAKASASNQESDGYPADWYKSYSVYEIIFHPIAYVQKLAAEDKLSIYFWMFLYIFLNVFIFFYVLAVYQYAIDLTHDAMKNGDLDVSCGDLCAANKGIIQRGFISRAGPWAKACGGCLNFNCALIVMPVTKLLLARLNNFGKSYSQRTVSSSVMGQFFAKWFAHPFTRYVPLSKNIEFHKIIGFSVFIFAFFHTIFHFANYALSSYGTLFFFTKFGWGGTTFLTGFIICFSMQIIFTAATNRVKNAMYENFFYAHHWFIVFFFFLLLHGPIFWCWSLIPLTLYIVERTLQVMRGGRAFVVTRVEWVKPVMAIKICPLDKSAFNFREGQYLYLNCPYINSYEWHPFTISSARGDLSIPGDAANQLRVCVETGEEVMPVPRPANLDKKYKWNKFCPISADWKKLEEWQYLDKHETCYHDYVSVHIKVHGLQDSKARTWTRKLKEYIELLSPGQSFPYHFSRRDERGDLQLGRRFGVMQDLPILRVDGPHAAPAEHYLNYKTVMIIGAGIGMTPCASVLTAMLKYRWRFGQPPEKLHFYWVVQHGEVDAFQWFLHLIAELEHEYFKQRSSATTEQAIKDWKKYYCEIHMFVTRAPKEKKPVQPMVSSPKFVRRDETFQPQFTADTLYGEVMNPSVSSKKITEAMASPGKSSNNLQDTWVWNGRPDWDQIFGQMKAQAVDPDIGCFFCGAAVIGADLETMCRKYTAGGVTFSLHKENF